MSNYKIIVDGKVIADDAMLCTSILSKARGLMFRKKPKTLIFSFPTERLVPLHMWFVFFPIDVLFLDKKKKVVETKEDFRPWHYYSPKKKAMYVIELSAGSIKKTSIKEGCTLNLTKLS